MLDNDTKNKISLTFQANVTRVQNLIAAYDELGTPGVGRPSVRQTDLLRSSVVLLHASLEGVLRTSSEHLIPLQSPAVLDEIGFPSDLEKNQKNRPKVTLGQLHRYKGRTVDDLIQTAVSAALQRSNFNNVREVAAALTRVGIEPSVLDPDQDALETIMRRRHLIVHRADKNPEPARGRGVPLTQHLAKPTVEQWAQVIAGVGVRIIEALPTV